MNPVSMRCVFPRTVPSASYMFRAFRPGGGRGSGGSSDAGRCRLAEREEEHREHRVAQGQVAPGLYTLRL